MRKTQVTRSFTSQFTPAPQEQKPESILPDHLSILTRAALLVGVFIFAGIASLMVLPLPALLVFKAAVLIAALSSAALAIYWLTQAINTLYLNQGAKTSQESTQAQIWEPSTPTQGNERLDHIARIILERYYLDELPVSRDACEQAGIATQQQWNQVNRVLKMIGVKGPRTFVAATYEEALEIWRNQVRVEPDAILVKAQKEVDDWTRLKAYP
jgi:hypothetical protein